MDALRAKIVETAFASLGEQEVTGPASNPTVLGWIRRWLPRATDDSTTAWCAVWVSQVMASCGLEVPATPFRAHSWLAWGTSTEDPTLGDVAVMIRDGGFHVGIVLRATSESIWLVGGNQGNAVSVARFDRKRVVQVRRA